MGQTLCQIDAKNLDQQANQLPAFTRPHSKIQSLPNVVEAIRQKAQERASVTQNVNDKVHKDIHQLPPRKKSKHLPKSESIYKEQIILPQPIKQQLQLLGEYTYHDGQLLPRGTMLGEIYLLKNGIKYKGQWRQDRIHGQGKYILQDGSLLEAFALSNQVVGVGRLINKNGDYYEGQFKQNQANGKGRYAQGNIIYQGQFVNNKPHGKGTEKGKDFSFTGHYQNGRRTHGRLQWKDQHGQYEYEGQFRDNKINGLGQLIDKGKIIKGRFVNGKLERPTF